MQCLVVVRADAAGEYTAQAVDFPEVRAVAATAKEAVEQVRQQLVDWLRSVKLVRVEVPENGEANPWLKSFGRSANDPEFDAYLEEIQKARQMDALE